jgi:DNA-binding phage protein
MAAGRPRRKLEDLTPEQRTKAESVLERWHSPETRAADVADREALAEEYRRTGAIETTGELYDVDLLLRLRQLLRQLKEHRERAGLNLATISERSGIDLAALSRLENGIGNPTFTTLSRYAKAVGVVLKVDYEVVGQ